MPKTSPRVAIIQQGGTPAYVRQGRVYEGGMFGGDLDEAVRGNPEAEAHALAYKSGMVGGFVTSILGAVGMGVGLGVFANDTRGGPSSTGGSGTSQGQTIGAGVFVGGVVAYVAGLALMLNAHPHMWDAINVYNDGLLPAPLPPRAPQLAAPGPLPLIAPPAAAATPPAVAAPPPAPPAPPVSPPPPAPGGETAPNH